MIKVKNNEQHFENDEDKFTFFFKEIYAFEETKQGSIRLGSYADGTIDKFISRIKSKVNDKRLNFLFGNGVQKYGLVEVLSNLLGYKEERANITIVDLSGVPFEALSITVSLITRLIFDYGYFYKRVFENESVKTPVLLVYEEAHKYVPKTTESKYKSSKNSIERIAKEGRKYGVTLMIVSQRPSEISETIFSQCNNYVVMRLTNPEDQSYVKRLITDNLDSLINILPVLGEKEAIVIGDSISMPSLVIIDVCDPKPSSNDIAFLREWKKKWHDLSFDVIEEKWKNSK